MQPFYENTKNNLEIFEKSSSHISPHLHKSIECVYVIQGTLELGIGETLYHMETGDFGIVFPELIHHYQVFDQGACRAIYLLASPNLAGSLMTTLQQQCPEQPVIDAIHVHQDIRYAMISLLNSESGKNSLTSVENGPEKAAPQSLEETAILHQAFLQIILCRALPCCHLVSRDTIESQDIVYQTVYYISAHFMEEITLSSMARDLGFHPNALSKVFSGVFHTNFSQFVNEMRLQYACSLLKYTTQSITDIYMNAGFNSQRTFNRTFAEYYHMTPREYRKQFRPADPA